MKNLILRFILLLVILLCSCAIFVYVTFISPIASQQIKLKNIYQEASKLYGYQTANLIEQYNFDKEYYIMDVFKNNQPYKVCVTSNLALVYEYDKNLMDESKISSLVGTNNYQLKFGCLNNKAIFEVKIAKGYYYIDCSTYEIISYLEEKI